MVFSSPLVNDLELGEPYALVPPLCCCERGLNFNSSPRFLEPNHLTKRAQVFQPQPHSTVERMIRGRMRVREIKVQRSRDRKLRDQRMRRRMEDAGSVESVASVKERVFGFHLVGDGPANADRMITAYAGSCS
jgi:hypothetical protein